MFGYPAWLRNHHIFLVDVRGAKVDDYVHNKQHVHHEVHYIQRVTRVATSPLSKASMLIQEEGSRVRSENSCVKNQEENNPVPKCLERAVVK